MNFGHTKVKVADVVVEGRAREDFGNMDELMASIEEFGLIQPIAIDSNNKLLAGGRRLEAHVRLGLEEIDAFCLGNISADNALIIELAENTVRKDFTWQEEIELKKKLHDLLDVQAQGQGEDNWTETQTAEQLGISKGQLSRDLTLAAAVKAMPELTQHETKTKALNAYGKLKKRAHAMILMNQMDPDEKAKLEEMQNMNPIQATAPTSSDVSEATESAEGSAETQTSAPPCVYAVSTWQELLVRFPDSSIGFCEMDPPYAMAFEDTYGQSQGIKADFKDWDGPTFKQEMSSLLAEIKPKLMPDSWVLLWTAIEWVPFLNETAGKLGYRTQMPGIWAKPGGAANSLSTNMISNYETYLLLAHGKSQFNTPRLLAAFEAKNLAGTDKIHATEKPVEGVYDRMFEAMAKPGTNFFSPFAGSGNCLIAAAEAGMVPFGCDTNEQYKEQFYARYTKRFNGGK